MVKSAARYADNQGLLRALPAAIDIVYAITVSIKTDDGLINSATCVLNKIQYLNKLQRKCLESLGIF